MRSLTILVEAHHFDNQTADGVRTGHNKILLRCEACGKTWLKLKEALDGDE
jgi:hypothetical protein